MNTNFYGQYGQGQPQNFQGNSYYAFSTQLQNNFGQNKFFGSHNLPQKVDVQQIWVNQNKGILNPVEGFLQGKEQSQGWSKGKGKGKGKCRKEHKKKHDHKHYAELLKQFDKDQAPAYQYKYDDGYSKDQKQAIEELARINNQQSANQFVSLDPTSGNFQNLLKDFNSLPMGNSIVPVQSSNPEEVGASQIIGSLPALEVTNVNVSSSNNFGVVSGVFGSYIPKPLTEEENEVSAGPSNLPPPDCAENFSIFKNQSESNQLDDLQELLKNSEVIQKAKSLAGSGKFTDPDFPPNVKTIIGFGEGKMREADFAKFPWLRPTEYFKGPYSVYSTISPGDIEQGSLGDCYFLASLSAIAENPERMERIFLTKQVDNQSVYVIAMCHAGIWTEVVVDDTTPCQPYSKQPIFNRSSGNELWVILLEKAWAKINGGFQNISGGLTREALRSFTGASCKTFFTQENREEIWKSIKIAEEMNFIMTAASDNLDNNSDAYQDKIGICGSHAYSLLDANEIHQVGGQWRKLMPGQKPQGPVERLVQLRNPWGKCEWKGAWSDTDPRWNPTLRQELEQDANADDGIFCMTYADFVKYYSDLQICYYHDKFKYSAARFNTKPNETVNLSFQITQKGVFYLSVNQRLKREFPKSKAYKFSNLEFSVSKLDNQGNPKLIGSQAKPDFENWIERELEPGNYVVMIKTPWVSCVNEFSFSVYGPEMVILNVKDPNAIPDDFAQKAIKNLAKDDTQAQTFDFGKQGYPEVKYKFSHNSNGNGYLYIENGTSNVVYTGTADFSSSSGIALKEPYNGYLKPVITLKPKENVTIAFAPVSFPCTIQFRLSANFDPVQSQNSLIDSVRQSKFIMKRRDWNGNDTKVWTHTLKHPNGVAVLYINKESDVIFNEEVVYNLQNCVIDGVTGNKLEVVLQPNTEKLIKFIPINKSAPFDARPTQMMSWFD